MRYLFFILALFFLSNSAPAQIQQLDMKKTQLAANYYRSQEYEKAAKLYEELYEETGRQNYYDNYVLCLVGAKKYDEAIKALKKTIRKDKSPVHFVTLGFIYKEQGEEELCEEAFNDAIKKLTANSAIIQSVANSFTNKREFDLAIQTYMRGRQLIPGEMFRSNLASLYSYQRNYQSMMEEYMLLLKEEERMYASVQARLNSILRLDFDGSLRSIIKTEILKGIQSEPNIQSYNHLLIWFFVKEKDYKNALSQAMALDRRTKSEEDNIVKFARGAALANEYDIAIRGLSYLLQREPALEPAALVIVKQERVRVDYLRYLNSPAAQRLPIQTIKESFEAFFNDVGITRSSADLGLEYAHFLAFHCNQPKEALAFIDKALSARDLNNNQRALLETKQADVKVYDGNLWEASLLYARIIEKNKSNPIGDDVKLKRAKLSYYLGDIEWSKAQLDVLKASTSKFIANDAMELSLLISGNYDMDTIVEPIQLFAQADLALFRNNEKQALFFLDSLSSTYPYHSLSDKILMRKAQISESNFEFEKAADFYTQLIANHAYSTTADDALYNLASLYETKLNNPEKAQELYKRVLLEYPGSIYVVDARKRFRILRGDIVEEELKQDEVF